MQRVYRGFKGRLYSKQRKAIELEKDTLRAAKENLFVEQMTNKVDTLLLPLNEHKVKKIYKKCTKKISDRYKVEKPNHCHQQIQKGVLQPYSRWLMIN